MIIRLLSRRFLPALISLFGVLVISFVLTRALPGDPAAYLAGPSASTEAVAEIRKSLGLDRSLPEQFVLYLEQIAGGELGDSWATGQPVLTELVNRLPASLELTAAGLLIALVTALPLGIFAALRPNSPLDHSARVVATLGVSALAPIARMTRASMLSVLASDYIRTARANRLPAWKVLGVYALRNALLPIVTMLGMVFSFLLGANVLVEKVFSWPGVGSFALEALMISDYAAVQGFVLAMGLLYVLLNLTIDLAYGYIDPRVRMEA
jgi:ABC-type dipeptide/oligopeptide/nickel transport system permease component